MGVTHVHLVAQSIMIHSIQQKWMASVMRAVVKISSAEQMIMQIPSEQTECLS